MSFDVRNEAWGVASGPYYAYRDGETRGRVRPRQFVRSCWQPRAGGFAGVLATSIAVAMRPRGGLEWPIIGKEI